MVRCWVSGNGCLSLKERLNVDPGQNDDDTANLMTIVYCISIFQDEQRKVLVDIIIISVAVDGGTKILYNTDMPNDRQRINSTKRGRQLLHVSGIALGFFKSISTPIEN
jgi:Fe-S cluster assembly iron-binding protein IscA